MGYGEEWGGQIWNIEEEDGLRMASGANLVSVSGEENALLPKRGSAEWVRNRERM